jgi:transposase
MFTERRRDFADESALQSRKRVGELLDVKAETLRGWIERVEVGTGVRAGTSTDVTGELTRLRRENAELRRANEILKTASAFPRRRSSTADSRDRRLHGRPQGPFRDRADLCGARRARHADRPVDLSRPHRQPRVRRGVGRRPPGERPA